MSGAGYVAVGVGGAVLGWLTTLLVLRRRHQVTAHLQPDPLERRVLDSSSSGYVVLDHGGHVLLSNPRAGELGVLSAGIVAAPVLEAAQRVAVSGEPVDVELRPQLPASLAPPVPQPIAVLAVVRSIGDELILVSAADESAAARVEAVRRDFIANVSHELKTPVAAIGLLAEAAVDSADDADSVRHFAGRLQMEASRLGVLVSELLTLSRLQGGDPLPDPAVVEVDAVVDEAVARLTAAAQSAGIALVTDTPSGLLVRGDRALLITALTNLVTNAINYSPSGTPVSISRACADGTVRLAVTDRGVGIAPEYTERVFERFFRIDPARSRSTGGTGLGLAIVKQVAANHAGSVSVWSRPGTGSTFTLVLPAYGEADPRKGTSGSSSAGTGPLPVHQGAA